MNIKRLGIDKNGNQSIEIRCSELTFRALLRHIRRIPGAIVTDSAQDPLNDNAKACIYFNGAMLTLETPFSDYVISSTSSTTFEDFISNLEGHEIRWWEKVF